MATTNYKLYLAIVQGKAKSIIFYSNFRPETSTVLNFSLCNIYVMLVFEYNTVSNIIFKFYFQYYESNYYNNQMFKSKSCLTGIYLQLYEQKLNFKNIF